MTEWECLACARKCDLERDDCCPTCGAELPSVEGEKAFEQYIPPGRYVVEDADGERFVKKDATQ